MLNYPESKEYNSARPQEVQVCHVQAGRRRHTDQRCSFHSMIISTDPSEVTGIHQQKLNPEADQLTIPLTSTFRELLLRC